MRIAHLRKTLLCVSMLVWGISACEADLQSTCVGGDGTCDPHKITLDTERTGAGGAAPRCTDKCDTETPPATTGAFPCAVEAIMDNCRRCHAADKLAVSRAPFPLDTYADAQQLFRGKPLWSRMLDVIITDFMPLKPPKLTADEKRIVVDEWVCECAPPRAAGEVCP